MKHLFPLIIFLSAVLVGTARADMIIIEDTFDGVADGTVLGGAQGWNAKWAGATSTQKELYTYDSGHLVLDTSVAERNYHALYGTAIDLAAVNAPIRISAEFQYTHEPGGNITANFNKNAFGLLVSTTPNWWNGTNKTTSIANRGGAIGNPLPVSPWVENWIPHSSVGVNTTTGGTSDWIRLEYVLNDNGTNVLAQTNIYDVASGNLLTPNSAVYDSGLVSGSEIYAGFSTAWNDVGDVPVSQFSNFSSVAIDNFRVTAVPEISSFSLVGIGLVGGLARIRRRRRR